MFSKQKIFREIPIWIITSLQNSNSPIIEYFLCFHDLVIFLIVIIIVNLMMTMFSISRINNFRVIFPESNELENLWLSIPIIFLIFVGIPRIKILYLREEVSDCDLNYKILGHQWYWSYEIMRNESLNFSYDSIINQNEDLFRLISTRNHFIVPIKCIIRFFISSEDVIHSWTVPSLGIKVDAVPGRVSQAITLINRPGILLGQCREICGVNHSFIPIVISANSLNNIN